MSTKHLIVPQAVRQTIIGVESHPITYLVEKGAILRFIRAINDDGPRFYGDGEPGNSFPDNMAAPPTFLCSLFSGLRELEWENPFEGLLDGNVEWEFLGPVHAGDNITVTSTIIDIAEKDGRLGSMLLVTTEFNYVNQSNTLVAVQRNTLIWYDPQIAHQSSHARPDEGSSSVKDQE